MRPEKCPACGGYCYTGNLFGNKVRHTGERGYEHECLRCPDGYPPPPPPPEHTADTERAAVVAWLREYCRWSENDGVTYPVANTVARIASTIERGEHRRKEGEK